LKFPQNFPDSLCLNVQNNMGSSSKTVQSNPKIRSLCCKVLIGLWRQVYFVDLSIESAWNTRISLSLASFISMECVNVCSPRSGCSYSVTILNCFITDRDVIIILLFYLSFLKRNRSLQRKIRHRKVHSIYILLLKIHSIAKFCICLV